MLFLSSKSCIFSFISSHILRLSVFLGGFYIFICFSHICNCSLNNFCDHYFKIFVKLFNISFFLVLVLMIDSSHSVWDRSSNTFVGCPSVLILGMSSSTNHHHISFLVVLLSTLSLMLTLIIAPTLILMIKYTSTVWGSYPWCYQKAQFNNISHRQPQPTENSQPWTSHYWTPFMHLFHILGEDVLACPQSTGPLYIHWCGSDHHMIYLLPSGMSPKDSQVTLSAGGFFWLFIVYPL